MSTLTERILFVGLGSPHGDDQIGWCVADALAAKPPTRLAIRKASVPTSLLDWLDGVDLLAVCDACRSDSPPGTVQRLDWEHSAYSPGSPILPALARTRTSGSHAFGLSAVLDLAHHLGRLPKRITVWGVEGQAFEPDGELSPRLKGTLPAITAAIWSDLSHA